MAHTVSPPMARKAERLADLLPTFSRGTEKRTGIRFYIVPGSKPGTGHMTNGLACTCRGFAVRSLCTHQLAVSMVQQRQEAPRIAAAQKNREMFGQCARNGCVKAATGKARKCDEHFAAMIAALGI